MAYDLAVLAPDGERQIEYVGGSVSDCWEHSNDMGSRWIFYPFHVVVSESHKTVIDTPDGFLSVFKGKRLKTLQDYLKANEREIYDFLNATL